MKKIVIAFMVFGLILIIIPKNENSDLCVDAEKIDIEQISKTETITYSTTYFFVNQGTSEQEIIKHVRCRINEESSQAFSLKYFDNRNNTPNIIRYREMTDNEVESQILSYSVNKKNNHSQGIWAKNVFGHGDYEDILKETDEETIYAIKKSKEAIAQMEADTCDNFMNQLYSYQKTQKDGYRVIVEYAQMCVELNKKYSYLSKKIPEWKRLIK